MLLPRHLPGLRRCRAQLYAGPCTIVWALSLHLQVYISVCACEHMLYCHGVCTALYCSVLFCTVLYCTVLYCTVLYCTVLYCHGVQPLLGHSLTLLLRKVLQLLSSTCFVLKEEKRQKEKGEQQMGQKSEPPKSPGLLRQGPLLTSPPPPIGGELAWSFWLMLTFPAARGLLMTSAVLSEVEHCCAVPAMCLTAVDLHCCCCCSRHPLKVLELGFTPTNCSS